MQCNAYLWRSWRSQLMVFRLRRLTKDRKYIAKLLRKKVGLISQRNFRFSKERKYKKQLASLAFMGISCQTSRSQREEILI